MLLDEIANVEEYGFDRRSFPVDFYGHHLTILYNDCCEHPETIGGIYHLGLHCPRCDEDAIVRGRLPMEDWVEYVPLVKWLLFSEFGHRCI